MQWNLRSYRQLLDIYTKWGAIRETLFVANEILVYYGGEDDPHVVWCLFPSLLSIVISSLSIFVDFVVIAVLSWMGLCDFCFFSAMILQSWDNHILPFVRCLI